MPLENRVTTNDREARRRDKQQLADEAAAEHIRATVAADGEAHRRETQAIPPHELSAEDKAKYLNRFVEQFPERAGIPPRTASEGFARRSRVCGAALPASDCG